MATACPRTIWMKDYDTEEWTEVPCRLTGRHSQHAAEVTLPNGGVRSTSFTSTASRQSREYMEADLRRGSTSNRRHLKAAADILRYEKQIAETEQKLAHYRGLRAEAIEVMNNNPLDRPLEDTKIEQHGPFVGTPFGEACAKCGKLKDRL